MHAFCVALVDPAPHQEPAAHGPSHVLAVLPVEEPYRPAAQAFCVALVEPVLHHEPAVHAFCVALEEPAPHHEPAAQGPEQVDEVRPAVFPYLPAAQLVQLAEQVAVHVPEQYVPVAARVQQSGAE